MNNDLKKQFEDKYPEWILLNHGDHKNDPCVIQHQCGLIKEYDSLSPFFQKSSPHCDICEFKKKFPNMKRYQVINGKIENNLTLEEKSYIYGLFLADGNLTLLNVEKCTGSIHLEINKKDEDIVNKLCNLIPYSTKTERVRNTNFMDNDHSVCFNISRKNFIKEIVDWGFPLQDKAETATVPNTNYDRNAFWRGFIDGDGSIGLRKSGNYLTPFLSITTKSDYLFNAFNDYLYDAIGKRTNLVKNKRDNIYNIVCAGKDCCRILKIIYQDATIYLDRKYNKYLECLEWEKENMYPKRSLSGIIGVTPVKDSNPQKWKAYITVNKKNINLGSYFDKNDAIIARLNAEREYWGEFAPQRHLFEEYGIEIENEVGDIKSAV